MAFFSRVRFTPATAKAACPQCGQRLTYERSCLRIMLTCHACGREFDPARFVDELDDDFDEAYANVPLDRM
ncbi:MAG: dual CXXC motif small (seleno)protein [Solidesulfovibrio sp. DCME]|uniref:dual CXXC motif small (seleno)protein n=1 Tax=Solidesulfovibrio sp. DCME TaxID=3447380 RepID=UPI003D0FC218